MGAIVGSIAAAAALLPRVWRAAWPVLVLLTLFLTPVVGNVISLEPLPSVVPFVVAAIGLYIMARGAVWRLALAAGNPGLGGLQIGGVEMRMFGAWTLAFSFLAIILGVLFVAMLVIAYAVASTGPGFNPVQSDTWVDAADWRGRIVLAAAMALAILALAYPAARISLGEAASIDRDARRKLTLPRAAANRLVADAAGSAEPGRLVMLATWPMTRRRWPPIVAVNVLLAAPLLLALLVWPHLHLAPWLASLLGTVVIVWQWLPMNVAALAWFYRDAREGMLT